MIYGLPKFILIDALLINSYFNNEIGHEKIAQSCRDSIMTS